MSPLPFEISSVPETKNILLLGIPDHITPTSQSTTGPPNSALYSVATVDTNSCPSCCGMYLHFSTSSRSPLQKGHEWAVSTERRPLKQLFFESVPNLLLSCQATTGRALTFRRPSAPPRCRILSYRHTCRRVRFDHTTHTHRLLLLGSRPGGFR